MRNEKGQFIKGCRVSPKTEFKKGEHWRKPQEFRDKDWLIDHYVHQQISTGDIAAMFGVKDAAILYWMRKHNIPRRDVHAARKLKHWGVSGPGNPMWGRNGALNPRWLGGVTPDRQAFYVSQEWKDACSCVWNRDKATCQRCGHIKTKHTKKQFHIHHIVAFSNKQLRADPNNLILLCRSCHRFVHSRRNIDNEYIQEI